MATDGETFRVFGRIRPLLPREGSETCLNHDDSRINISAPSKSVQYQLTGVLGQKTTQKECFDRVKPQINAFLKGFNSTIFAYGQTGTGKTYTMLGVDFWELAARSESPTPAPEASRDTPKYGIIPRAMTTIFRHIEANSGTHEFQLSCSYFEVYNEKLYDLLAYDNKIQSPTVLGSPPRREGSRALDVREDKHNGIFVPGSCEIVVGGLQEVISILWQGARHRAVSATDMNEHSSRSHTIFQLQLEQRLRTTASEGGTVIRSKLNLVDLAGSEKWRPHQLATFSDRRIAEMTAINQSLSNLGNCIRALLDKERAHVPYRNSKLTRLLQDSLGGNTKTTFIVTMSRSMSAMEESISTLSFADRAMKVEVHATKNERLDTSSLLKQQQFENAKLKALVKSLRAQNDQLRAQLASNQGSLTTGGGIQPSGRLSVAAEALVERKLSTLPSQGTIADRSALSNGKKLLKRYHQWLSVHVDRESAGKGQVELSEEERLMLVEWSVLLSSVELGHVQGQSKLAIEDLERRLKGCQRSLRSCQAKLAEANQRVESEAWNAAEAQAQLQAIEEALLQQEQQGSVLGKGQAGSPQYSLGEVSQLNDSFEERIDDAVAESLHVHMRGEVEEEEEEEEEEVPQPTNRWREEADIQAEEEQIRVEEALRKARQAAVGKPSQGGEDVFSLVERLKEKTNVEKHRWEKHLDPSSKLYYYWCSVTGETQWERPEEFIE